MRNINFDIQRFADSITPTKGDDIIYNKNGDYSYIDADEGNDYIYGLDNDYVTVHGNIGEDTIVGTFYNSEIYGDEGNDNLSIVSSNDSNSIFGGDGNDTIHAFTGYIDGGEGSDTIILLSSTPLTTTIIGGKGDDVIYGYRSTDQSAVLYKYSIGDGNDLIYNYKVNDTISVGNSWSTIAVDTSNLVIEGSHTLLVDVDDIFGDNWYLDKNYSDTGQVVSVTADLLYVKNPDYSATMQDSDSAISLQGVDLTPFSSYLMKIEKPPEQIKLNDNDSVYPAITLSTPGIIGSHVIVHVTDSYGSSETGNILLWDADTKKINMAQSGNFIVNTNPDAVISMPSSSDIIDSDTAYYTATNLDDIIDNSGNNSYINTGAGNDSIKNNDATVTVKAGAGNDTISGTYVESALYGESGNDYIEIVGNANSVDGGAGNDTIIANGGSIDGGNGNDIISLTGSGTISGGKGNDTIYADSDTSVGFLYRYFYGDGNDTIYNFDDNDTITIEDPNNSDANVTWATLQSGNNIIVNVLNSGTITLYNASGTSLSVSGTSSNYIVNTEPNTTLESADSDILNDIVGRSTATVTAQSTTDNDKSTSTKRERTVKNNSANTTSKSNTATSTEVSTATVPADNTTSDKTVTPVTVSSTSTSAETLTPATVSTATTTTSATTTDTPSATFNANKNSLVIKGNFATNIWLDGNPFTGQRDSYANANTVTIDASQQTSLPIILAGNDRNNVIRAGTGRTSLWGGVGGNDTLIGGSGRDMFWFTEGGGNDVVRNFNAGTDSDSDVINLVGGISSLTRSNGNLNLQMNDGSSVNMNFNDSSVDKAIQYSTDATHIISAKIGNTNSGNTLTYDSEVDYYLAGGGENTLSIGGSNNVEVWLDRDKFNGIKTVNAGNSSGNILMAGDNADNRIIAGNGNSSLWGGSGGNDTLIGGSGVDMFWYGKNNGNDIIQNASEGDVINLYDVNLADIAEVNKTGSNLVFTTNSGDKLTVTGNSTATFRLADGSNWKYNHSGNNWTQS